MGQKVNPLGMRLGITRDWTSRWYAGKKQFPVHVHTDFRVRRFLKDKLKEASVSRVMIERAAKKVNITIQTARPGIVIGKKGEDIEKLRQETAALLGMSVNDVRLNIAEIRKPELDAQLVADSIAQQIEKRVMFRRAMKRAVMSTMRSGALGVKVRVSGRLNGSEIARTEWYREGRIPLHTFRADIDYGLSESRTTYGVIGVKVWIFKGEVFDKTDLEKPAAEGESAAGAAAATGACAPARPATRTPAPNSGRWSIATSSSRRCATTGAWRAWAAAVSSRCAASRGLASRASARPCVPRSPTSRTSRCATTARRAFRTPRSTR